MKICDILNKQEKGVSFEFFPPKGEKGKPALAQTIKVLKEYHPLYVSMTYGAGGTTQARTLEAVKMLIEEGNLEVMPHLTCIGAKADTVRLLLEGYEKQGLENIMALRGDLSQGTDNFDSSQRDFSYAIDLVSIIKNYGRFSIGVAVYPEGHIETHSLELDMEYTKRKIDAGADFAVTQMFFDNSFYYSFMERIKKNKIDIPILPGILPLTDVEKIKQFAAVCRATIPARIREKMEGLRDNPDEMEKVGIDFTIQQCIDLIAHGFKKLHFFTLNKPKIITAILDALP
ncbi:MAG: methylenetetrahydrofolate reductase [NAD(P)H] [Candidatus Omnitrophica bacterium]|nr:methylenetetrahydrofolate reductase [NAD(P)H] [Candidatus Omnitrophota bacterium]MBU4478535.1 methylenetetrahydrofolate reductase [NAD(P)H] [Candidatus Omnitrophota bacterium]MCG2702868.1 methylenetetrahydrofolate reductase [NAD(P)H] [Candidatus Omnitrophota bacterium]